jgi:hypothetical protein
VTLAAKSLVWAQKKMCPVLAWEKKTLGWGGARWDRHWRAVDAGRAVSLWHQTATVLPGVVAEQFEPLQEISCPCGHGDLRQTDLTRLGMAPAADAQQVFGRQSETGDVRSRDGCRIGTASSGWLGGIRGATDLSTAGVRRNKRFRGTKC